MCDLSSGVRALGSERTPGWLYRCLSLKETQGRGGEVERVVTYIIINSKPGVLKFQKNPNKPSHI